MIRMSKIIDRTIPNDALDDELLWVKAGTPGEKPTILRKPPCNMGGAPAESSQRRTVGLIVSASCSANQKRTSNTTLSSTTRSLLSPSSVPLPRKLDASLTHSNNKTLWRTPCRSDEGILTKHCSRARHTPDVFHMTKPLCSLQPIPLLRLDTTSPSTLGHKRLGEHCLKENKLLNNRDDGYTSLSSDESNEKLKRKNIGEQEQRASLPSSWRPCSNDNLHERSLRVYSQRLTSNEQKSTTPLSWCDPSLMSTYGTTSFQKSCDKSTEFTSREPPSERRKKVELVLDYSTCFFCLRSAVYHGVQDEDDTDSLVDHPCRCDKVSGSCCSRWALIGLMVCFLPFLLCYPPIKACLNLHDYRKRRKKLRKQLRDQRTGTNIYIDRGSKSKNFETVI